MTEHIITRTGPWYEASATRAEYPDREAYWDLPGHLPWVVVAQTPCPGATEPAVPAHKAVSYLCRHKHVHTKAREQTP